MRPLRQFAPAHRQVEQPHSARSLQAHVVDKALRPLDCGRGLNPIVVIVA